MPSLTRGTCCTGPGTWRRGRDGLGCFGSSSRAFQTQHSPATRCSRDRAAPRPIELLPAGVIDDREVLVGPVRVTVGHSSGLYLAASQRNPVLATWTRDDRLRRMSRMRMHVLDDVRELINVTAELAHRPLAHMLI